VFSRQVADQEGQQESDQSAGEQKNAGHIIS
jgi:hypothetical protein